MDVLISFEILRSVLVAVRGVRGKIRQMKVDPISTGINFLTREITLQYMKVSCARLLRPEGACLFT